MISTLQKLTGIGSDIGKTSSSNINFNANLPVTLEVLRQIDPLRYMLKIGRKEISTKSNRALKKGEKYWANFSEGKGGVISISHLFRQPQLFENEELFLPLMLENIFDNKSFSSEQFKSFLLKELSQPSIEKPLFKAYSFMLLALSRGVIHLPLINENKKVMLQLQIINENTIAFYLAFEHLGPLLGIITHNEIQMNVMYEKSFYYLKKADSKFDKKVQLHLEKEFSPLFDLRDLALDLKG